MFVVVEGRDPVLQGKHFRLLLVTDLLSGQRGAHVDHEVVLRRGLLHLLVRLRLQLGAQFALDVVRGRQVLPHLRDLGGGGVALRDECLVGARQVDLGVLKLGTGLAQPLREVVDVHRESKDLGRVYRAGLGGHAEAEAAAAATAGRDPAVAPAGSRESEYRARARCHRGGGALRSDGCPELRLLRRLRLRLLLWERELQSGGRLELLRLRALLRGDLVGCLEAEGLCRDDASQRESGGGLRGLLHVGAAHAHRTRDGGVFTVCFWRFVLLQTDTDLHHTTTTLPNQKCTRVPGPASWSGGAVVQQAVATAACAPPEAMER